MECKSLVQIRKAYLHKKLSYPINSYQYQVLVVIWIEIVASLSSSSSFANYTKLILGHVQESMLWRKFPQIFWEESNVLIESVPSSKVGLYQVLANYTIPILYWRKQLLYYTIPIPILYQFFRRVYSCIHVF